MLSPNQAFEEAELALRERRVHDALTLYLFAEAHGFDPDACAGARWLCHMLLGDFTAAWKESDAIEKNGRPDANRFWTGQPLRGRRVLVRCLHGLGDTIQYLRYAPLLKREVASLIIEAQPILKRLVEKAEVADHVITWGEPEPAWDEQIEIIELPRIFQTTLETIPNGIPYLKSNPRPFKGTNFKVGLVWASSGYNPARSIPLTELARVCGVPSVEFYSFQAGDNREELLGADLPIKDAFDDSGCVQAAADGLSRMDLLITVDTMMAHLGGGLGIPVWLLLPFQADWRWMLERSDSPWYPTVRLFRQPYDGGWDMPIEQICTELQLLVCASGAGPGREQ